MIIMKREEKKEKEKNKKIKKMKYIKDYILFLLCINIYKY